MLFIVVTIVSSDILSVYMESGSLIIKGVAFLCKKYLQLLCAASGVAFVYGMVNYLIEGTCLTIPRWLVELNGLCFGIYLFQQFILQILYYKTNLPSLVGPYWLPWVGLVVTLILSYLLTKLSLKTKVGRQLM